MALGLQDTKADRASEARLCYDRIENFKRSSGYDNWVTKLSDYDVQWRGKTPRDNKPWEHASDYNPLITYSKVEDVHAILFGFFSSLSFFNVAASQRADIPEEVMRKRAEDWTYLLKWSMANESNAVSFLDRFIHDGCQYGYGVGYMPWQRRSRKMRTEVFLPDELRFAKTSDKKLIIAGLGPQLKKGPQKWGRPGDETYSVEIIDEDGVERDAICWIDRKNPMHSEDEAVLIIEREVVWYNAPRPINVAPWDMLVPPDVRDLQSAKFFWHRQHMGYNQIAEYRRKGMFNALSQLDLGKMKKKAASKYPDVGGRGVTTSDTVDSRRDAELQVQKVESQRDQFEVFFEYRYEDIDDDGIEESIVRAVTDFGQGPVLLMRHNVEYLFPHGRRPFFDWHFEPIDHRYYGQGIPEILERTQDEGNAYYQSRSDVLEIITKPGGFYDPMSGLAPHEIRYTPGMMIKVRDPDTAFRPLAFPVDPMLLLREQSGMEAEAERGIGSTDMGLGRSSGRPNSPRTLGGTAIIVRQQQLRSNVYLQRAMFGSGEYPSGVIEFLCQYHDLYEALMPSTKEFRAMGTDEIRSTSREDLQGRYDFVIDIGEEINNPQLRMQNSVLRYQNAMSNPLILQDPVALWTITVDMLEATGMKSAGRILKKPGPVGDHPPMSQEEENVMMAKGVYIEPLMMDDHAAHLTVIMDLIQNDLLLAEQFTPAELKLLEKHTQKHQEMLFAAANPAGAPPSSPPANGGQPRSQRQQMSMGGYGPNQPMETYAGPIEADSQAGQMM